MIKVETSSNKDNYYAKVFKDSECLLDIKFNSQLTFLWTLEFAHHLAEEANENKIIGTFNFFRPSDGTYLKKSFEIPVNLLCAAFSDISIEIIPIDSLAHSLNDTILNLTTEIEDSEED